MRTTPGILGLVFLLATGCSGRANIAETVTSTENTSAIDQITPDKVSDGSNRTLSFTTDTVTHDDIDGTETGKFSNIDESGWIANLGSGSVNFKIDGDSIIWDEINYQRVATSRFDSRQALISFFNGSTYKTLGQFDIGEDAFGGVALGQWTVQFADNQVVWSVQDIVSVGTISFIDGSSFKIDTPFAELTAFVLNDNQLVIDSIVYQREERPDSQL